MGRSFLVRLWSAFLIVADTPRWAVEVKGSVRQQYRLRGHIGAIFHV